MVNIANVVGISSNVVTNGIGDKNTQKDENEWKWRKEFSLFFMSFQWNNEKQLELSFCVFVTDETQVFIIVKAVC